MGNCYKSSNHVQQSREGDQLYQRVYNFSQANKNQQEQTISYCNKLKNISNQYVTPLSNFNVYQDKILLSTRVLDPPYSLASFLEEKKNTLISSETAEFILKQLCRGVQYLHQNDIIHGDLIPMNIQINTSTNAVRISNMSLPHSVANTTQVEIRVSSYEFDPPEKQTQEDVSIKSDLYSLGAIGLALFGIKHGNKMTKPLGCTERLFNKLKELTNKDASSRPPLNELLDILENKSQSPEDVEIIKDKELQQNDAKLLDSFKEVPIDNAGDKYQNKNIDIQIPPKKEEQKLSGEDEEHLKSQRNKVKRSSTIEKKEDKSMSVQEKYEVIQNQLTNQDQNQPKENKQQTEILINKQIVQGNMKLKSRIECSSNKLSSLVYSDIHKVIIAGGVDGILSMYKVSKEGELQEVFKSNPTEISHGISQLLLSEDNNTLFVSLYSPSILVYSLNKSQLKLIGQISEILTHSLISFDISPNMKSILVTGANNQAFLFDLNKYSVSNKRRIEGFSGYAPICRFVNSKILLGLSTGKVLIYEENNLKTPIQELALHSAAITRISISPNIISFASLDGTISLMNHSFALSQTLHEFKDSVSSAMFTNDSQFIASACWDGIIRLFQVDSTGSFKLIDQFSNLTSWVNDVVYLPSDKILISIGGPYLSAFK